jgi:hypothetical protein
LLTESKISQEADFSLPIMSRWWCGGWAEKTIFRLSEQGKCVRLPAGNQKAADSNSDRMFGMGKLGLMVLKSPER